MATIWKRFKNIGLLFIAASLVTLLSLHKKVFNLTSQQMVFLKERIVNRCQQTSQMEREEIAIEANLISLSEWVRPWLPRSEFRKILKIVTSVAWRRCYRDSIVTVNYCKWLYSFPCLKTCSSSQKQRVFQQTALERCTPSYTDKIFLRFFTPVLVTNQKCD